MASRNIVKFLISCTIISYAMVLLEFISASVAVSVFNSKYYLSTTVVDYKSIYGLTVAVCAATLYSIYFTYSFPTPRTPYILNLVIHFALVVVNIVISRQASVDSIVEEIGSRVSNTAGFRQFQYDSQCCGWLNYTDRAIQTCPLDYVSGCRAICENYFSEQIGTHYVVSIIVLAVTVVTMGICLAAAFTKTEYRFFLHLP